MHIVRPDHNHWTPAITVRPTEWIKKTRLTSYKIDGRHEKPETMYQNSEEQGQLKKIYIYILTNLMAYGTRRFDATFTRALQ